MLQDKQKMLKALNRNTPLLAIFGIFYLLSLLFYFQVREGMLTSDFYNWVYIYETEPISELIACYGYPGLHQMYHFPFFIAYKIFGLNAKAWILLFTFIHSVNATLLLIFCRKLLTICNKPTAFALVPSLLFLLSPYQTEAVAWGATIHYLLITAFFLLSLIFLIKFIETENKSFLRIFLISFALSLFTMEQSFLFPLCYLAVIILLAPKFDSKFMKTTLVILAPTMLIVVIYFLLSKITFGALIGHYGAEEHLKFNFFEISTVLFQYVLKFIAFFRFIPFEKKHYLIKLFQLPVFQLVVLAMFFVASVYAFFFQNKNNKNLFQLIMLCTVIAIFCLGPVLNIAMDSLYNLQTDRYSYLPSVFIYIALSLLLLSINIRFGYLAGLAIILFSTFHLYKTTADYKETGILKNMMLENFLPFSKNQHFLFLNMPDNYKGVHLFRNGFSAASDLHHLTSIRGKMDVVAHVNFLSIDESIDISRLENDTILLQLPKWGRWVHTHTTENDYYYMTPHNIDGFYIAYKIFFKDKAAESTKLFWSNGNWHQLDFN
jgi:hypothetical protein